MSDESSCELEKNCSDVEQVDDNEIESVDTEKDCNEKVDENMKISEEIVEEIVKESVKYPSIIKKDVETNNSTVKKRSNFKIPINITI